MSRDPRELVLLTRAERALAEAATIDEIKDIVRQAHYLQKLSNLVDVSEGRLEAALKRTKANQQKRPLRQAKESKRETLIRAVPSLLSSPLEEYCLILLLKYPMLKKQGVDIRAEYFENSVNREIFVAWQQTDDLSSLKTMLDAALWEHIDTLANRNILTNQIELKYADCARNLHRKYLQNLEAKRAEVFALEVESGGPGADLAKLLAEGIEPSIQLGEVDRTKNRSGAETRR